MNEQEPRKLKKGDITIIDGRVALVESADENSITYYTCSISFVNERKKQINNLLHESWESFEKILGEDENEKDETDKGDQSPHQDAIG